MVLLSSKSMSVKAVKLDDTKTAYQFLRATDITPQDDAFHGNINLLDIEWWYFDAVFDNGYSIHVGVRIYHVRNSGIVQSRINIYKNGKIKVESLKTDLLNNFYTSYDPSPAYILIINQSSSLTKPIIKKQEGGDITYY